MKTKTLAAIAFAATALVCTSGCTTTQKQMMPGTLVPSTKPIEQGKYTVLNGGKTVTGKYTMDYLHSSNTDFSKSAMKQAVDMALSQAPGADALVDVKTDSMTEVKMLIFPIQFPLRAEFTTFVTGVPVKTND